MRGLTASDFEIREDGKPQEISNFSFEEVNDKKVPAVESADLLAGVEAKLAEDAKRAATTTAAPAARPKPPTPMTSDMLAGRRLITLVFDVSSMQPEDVQRAVDSAKKYVDEKMSAGRSRRRRDRRLDAHRADRLHRRSRESVARRSARSPTPTAPRRQSPAASTAATDEAAAAATDDTATRTPPSSTCSTTTCGCAR